MTGGTDKVKIELNYDDAEKFKLFMQYYDTFSTMLNDGVFNIKNSSVELHFDAGGNLMQVARMVVIRHQKVSTLQTGKKLV